MSVFLEILKDGSGITWLIFAMGFVSLVIVIERFLNLRRAEIDVTDFLPGVINTLRSQNIKEAILICDETPGPASHVVREAIMHSRGGKDEMYRATKKAALTELPRLERMMKALLTIVHVCPLLGLLGTVLGLVGVFSTMVDESATGTEVFMSVKQMAPHIKTALLSTAAGLTIAIPTYMCYNYFRQKVDNILIEMEKAAVEIIYFLSQPIELQQDFQEPETESQMMAPVPPPE